MFFRFKNFNFILLTTMIIVFCLFNLMNRFLFDVMCRMAFESMTQSLRTFSVLIETFNAFSDSKDINVKLFFETFSSISVVFANSPSALFFSAFCLAHLCFHQCLITDGIQSCDVPFYCNENTRFWISFCQYYLGWLSDRIGSSFFLPIRQKIKMNPIRFHEKSENCTRSDPL